MFDPDFPIDERLAAAIGIYGATEFLSVPKGRETELKFLVDPHGFEDFERIRHTISSSGNRVLDPRTYEIKLRPLVTLNIDTLDQKIRRAGFSARVRFEFDISDLKKPPERIDISVKTRLSNGNVIFLNSERGEWEAELPTLIPELSEIPRQNAKARKNDREVPSLIRNGGILSDQLFVESVGSTWRRNFTSTHLLPSTSYAALYAHTEDCNLFTTPYCDVPATHFDREAEAELKGIFGNGATQISQNEFERLTETSLRKTSCLIENCSSTVIANKLAKSDRGAEAVRAAYHEYSLISSFGKGALCPIAYSLKQRVKPQDINLENLAMQMGRMLHDINRSMPRQLAIPARGF
ncbi:MAG: hypothetical protein R3D88_06795 [Alphaproteobacteria bacterium]|nr:hypothetical protein [Alphaproteobacteria bacterium]